MKKIKLILKLNIFILFWFLIAFILHINISETNIEKQFYYHVVGDVELGENIDIYQLIETNANIVEYDKINVGKIGENYVDVVFEFENSFIKKTIFYNVVDTIKPKIYILKDFITLDDIDNIKIFTVEDNDLKTITTTKILDNKYIISAKDQSNNEEILEVPIKMVEKNILNDSKPKLDKKNKLQNKNNLKNVEKKINKKQFLFRDGYDFNTAYQSCFDLLKVEESGSCIPIKLNQVYIGYQFTK